MRRDTGTSWVSYDNCETLTIKHGGVTVELSLVDTIGFPLLPPEDVTRLIAALSDEQIIRAALLRLEAGYGWSPETTDDDVLGRAALMKWLPEQHAADTAALIRERDSARRDAAKARGDAYSARHNQNMAADAAWAAVWAIRCEVDATSPEGRRRKDVADAAYYAALKTTNGALELCQ